MNKSGATRVFPSSGPGMCAGRKDKQLSFAKAARTEVAQERAQLS